MPGVYQFKCKAVSDSIIYKMFFIDNANKEDICKDYGTYDFVYSSYEDRTNERRIMSLDNKRLFYFTFDCYFTEETDTLGIFPFSIYKRNEVGAFEKIATWSAAMAWNEEHQKMWLDSGLYIMECTAEIDGMETFMTFAYGDVKYKGVTMSDLDGSLLGYSGTSNLSTSELSTWSSCDTVVLNYNTNILFQMFYENQGWDSMRIDSLPAFSVYKRQENGEFEEFFHINSDCFNCYDDEVMQETFDISFPAGTYRLSCNPSEENINFYVLYDILQEDVSRTMTGEGRGGLRIASISGEKEIRYEYEGGIQTIEPCTTYIEERWNTLVVMPIEVNWYKIKTAESTRSLSTMRNGNIVGYSRVKEIQADGSWKEYVYHNEKESVQNDDCPYSPTHIDWQNGSLLNEIHFDENGDTLSFLYNRYHLKETENYFKLGCKEIRTGYFFDYYLEVFHPELVRSIKVDYTDNGNHKTETTYCYDSLTLLCTNQETICQEDAYSETFIYPSTLSGRDAIFDMMLEENMVSVPIGQLKARNGQIFDGEYIVYDYFDLRILPKHLLSLNTGAAPSSDILSCSFDTITTFTEYNDFGKARTLYYKGTPRTILWGYNGQCPIAEISNATYNQLIDMNKFIPNENATCFDEPDYQMQQIWGSISVMPEVSVKQCYYKPLVGPIMMCDEKGIVHTYDYDKANRLQKVSYHGTAETYCYTSPELQKSFSYCYGADNHVTTTSYLSSNLYNSIISTQYYDQWGRPSLTASQGANPSGAYSYGLQTYDELGRASKSWAGIPTEDAQSQNLSDDDFVQLSNSTFGDAYGYSETTYDALGRVVKTTTPGKAWHDANKATTCQYLTNTANEVKRYVVSGNSMSQNGFVPAGTLAVTQTTDPDGHTVKTYKDLFGNVVLERRAGNIDTYFVYDNYNRLRFVLQPMYQSEASLDKFAFQYRYDGQGRIIWKKLPGCQYVTCEYDGLTDRVIKMQDGLLRAKGKFRTYEYDGLGRMVSQGISDGNETEYEVHNYYDDYGFLNDYEYLVPNGIRLFYPNETLYGKGQLIGTWQKASNGEELLTSYGYDEYGRMECKSELGLDNHISMMEYQYNYAGDIQKEWFTEYQYNDNGSLTEVFDGNIENKYDILHTKLPSLSVIELYDVANDITMTDTISAYTYDDFGRIIAKNRSGAAGDMSYEYDNLHGWLTCIRDAKGIFEQKLFRETGGKTPCFNGSISAVEWKTTIGDRQRYDFAYDGLNRLTWADYHSYRNVRNVIDGVVSTTSELIPSSGGSNYDFSTSYNYDKNSNLTWIERQGWTMSDYDTVDDIDIVRNGNQLKSTYDSFSEELTYTGAFDFVDGADEETEYFYDDNGNLIKDLNKGLIFEYDLLGHPLKVSGSKSDIEYVYAADGRKLRTVHKQYASADKRTVMASTQSDYQGKFIFKNGVADMCLFDDGYYLFQNGKLKYTCYYIKDYQGNNSIVTRNNVYLQRNNYYPYGALNGRMCINPDKQPFKYSGKELDRQFGLDLYDFHARQYDPLLGSFTSIDPLAEKDYGVSPYAYCKGNPVNMVDKDGKMPQVVVGAIIGGIIEGGFEMYNQLQTSNISDVNWAKVGVAVGKGAADGAIASTGLGLVGELVVNMIGDAAIETVGQAVEMSAGLRSEINSTEIGHAAVSGGVSTLMGHGPAKLLEKKIATHYKSASVVREMKQDLKNKMKSCDSSISTAGDKSVKKAAKAERNVRIEKKSQQVENAANAVTQTVTDYVHREYDKQQ